MLVLDEVLDHAETNILASTKHGEEKEGTADSLDN